MAKGLDSGRGTSAPCAVRRDLPLLVASAVFLAIACHLAAAESDDAAKADIVPLPTSRSTDPAPQTDAEPEPAAVVVDLGDGHEYLPPASGPMVVPKEEPGPPNVQPSRGHVRPGDPEWVRDAPDDGEPLGVGATAPKTVAPRRGSVVRSGDPEWVRHVPDDGEPPAADEMPTRPTAQANRVRPGDPELPREPPADEPDTPDVRTDQPDGSVTRAAAGPADRPRFVSGDGLDSDAAEVAADLVLSERQAAAGGASPGAKKEDAVGTAPPEPPATPEAEEKARLVSTLRDIAAQTAGLGDSRAAAKRKAGRKPNEPVDEQKRAEELIEIIQRNKTLLEDAYAASKDRTVHGPSGEDTGVRVRDPRARPVLEAFLKNTPLGTIAGAITDATGKQLVPARVRLTDITETSIQAPLAEGFWCTGRFAARVVSGPVKIEVTRGRFYSTIIKAVQAKANGETPFETALTRPAALNFAAQGWYLADLDLGLRVQPGERRVWLGAPPELDNLIVAAQAEGVQILGVPLPWGSASSVQDVEALAEKSGDVVLLPVFPGPRHAFCGSAMALGLKGWDGLPVEIGAPETPLREVFEDIRARGGLAVYKDLNGGKRVDIRRDVFSLFPRLERTGFYPPGSGTARLYAANELPFDTVVGPAYEAIAFDGSPAAEQLWFNLLNQGYTLSVIGAGGGSLEGGRVPYGQTFVGVTGQLSRDGVVDAIRKGRTCVSFGPAAFCRVLERDKGPGAMVLSDGRRLTLQIQAYASMTQGTQLDKIEVIRNGQVVHTQTAGEGQTEVTDFAYPLSEIATAWYVVRVTERRVAQVSNLRHGPGTAWTGAIYFRGPAFVPPAPAVSRIKGTLYCGLTPVPGTVTAVAPGQQPRQVATDANGNYRIELPACGSLVFEARDAEPLAQRVSEHPKVQRALGALQAERDGLLCRQFEKQSLFPAWRLLLADLEWNVTLLPPTQPSFQEPAEQNPGKR